jgi:hypothetical protein
MTMKEIELKCGLHEIGLCEASKPAGMNAVVKKHNIPTVQTL